MKIINKVRDCIEHGIDVFTMAIFLLLFLVGLYALVDVQKVNASADVDAEVAELAPSKDDSEIDIAALREINPEIVGWIRIDGTNINYPVVQSTDNTKYLNKDYRGEYATAGAVFVDYRNNKFLDDFTIIYAHRMNGGLMFGEVAKFSEANFFRTHETGALYTEDTVYDLEISDFAVLNIDTTKLYAHDMNKNGQNVSVVSEIRDSAKQSRKVDIGDTDQILLLSTCDKDSKHYRDVLLVKMNKREK